MKRHVKIDRIKKMPNLFCCKVAVSRNYNSTHDNENVNSEKSEKSEKSRQYGEDCVNISMTVQMQETFETYLSECAKVFWKKINKMEGLEQLRSQIKRVWNESERTVVQDILAGDIVLEML